MQQHIYLGIHGDSPVHHTCTTAAGNYAGQIAAGPLRLLEFLELQLGISVIMPSDKERTLLLKERLHELPQDKFPFAASFEKDPLGVAKRLLKLWDSWRVSGWDMQKSKHLPLRMQQLLLLTPVFNSIGMGMADRIARLMQAIKKDSFTGLTIHMVDPFDFFPYVFQQLIKKLELHVMHEEVPKSKALPASDLGKLQSILQCKKDKSGFVNDGSLQLLFFKSDIHAANAVYSIQRSSHWNPLLIGSDNSLLHGLHLSRNTPVCNWQTVAGNGQVSQLFHLAIALFKRPVNSSQVLAFLSAPVLPFSKRLAHPLLQQFSAMPGFGNQGWNGKIEDYLENIKSEKGTSEKSSRVKFWLQNDRHLDDNYDIALLNDIFSNLGKWASQFAHLEYYQLYAAQLHNLSSLCHLLIQSLQHEGDEIKPAKFERLQSELFADVPATITEAQVGCSDQVEIPAMVWSPVKESCWLNAVRYESSGYLSKYWYQEEKDFFSKQNLPVHDESHAQMVYNHGLQRMILNTTERLVIVVPATVGGAKAAKPFCLDEWATNISLQPVSIHADDLLEKVPWNDKVLIKQYPRIYLPVSTDYLKIQTQNINRKVESYSSIENLIQHPAKWYIEYMLYLRYQAGVSLPAENALRGTIADSIVQVLFTQQNTTKAWWKNQGLFRKQVLSTLDDILVTEGLPFLEVVFARTLHEYKHTLINALCALRSFIDVNGFEIIGTQISCTGKMDETPFAGPMDLVLSRTKKNYIIDLKWAGSTNMYKGLLETGTDLQLIFYQTMYNAVSAGYFLLNEGRVFMRRDSHNENLKDVYFIEGPEDKDAKDFFNEAVKGLQYRRKQLKEGLLEVAYDVPLEEIEYYNDQEDMQMFPLKEGYDKGFKRTPYGTDLNLLFGKIH